MRLWRNCHLRLCLEVVLSIILCKLLILKITKARVVNIQGVFHLVPDVWLLEVLGVCSLLLSKLLVESSSRTWRDSISKFISWIWVHLVILSAWIWACDLLLCCGLSKHRIAGISLLVRINTRHAAYRAITIDSGLLGLPTDHHSIVAFILALLDLCHAIVDIGIIIAQVRVAAEWR